MSEVFKQMIMVRERRLHLGRNDSLDVSRAVQNPNYLDSFGYLSVKDNVVPNRKAA
jgi:hypothetical protein